MPTDNSKTLNGTPEPFRRPMVWGRPPVTVFRTGPLPKGGTLPAIPEAPRLQPTPGVLSGSMIPRTAPKPLQARAEAAAPPVARAAEPRPEGAPSVPGTAPRPDLTVRPLLTVEPEPARPPEPVRPPVSVSPVVVAADAADTVPPVSVGRKSPNRVPLYAGIALAAVTVLTLGGWIWTRPRVEAAAPAVAAVPALVPPAPVAGTLPPEGAPVSVPVTEAPVEAPDRVVAPPVARPTATVPAPARATPPPAIRPPSVPVAVAPPPTDTPPPETLFAPAPEPGPAPTEAERPSSDPDAPIATRPQPVG